MTIKLNTWAYMLLIGVMTFALASWADGRAGADQPCPKGLTAVTEFRLFFGLAHADGRTLTEEQWQEFLADTITPRFRAGLTVLDARGQWLTPAGVIEREPVKLLIGSVSSDAAAGMKLVDEISRAFQERFNQDPVYRMSNPACAGLYQ